MTLELHFDEFHSNGELVDVHAAVTVHVSQSPADQEKMRVCPVIIMSAMFKDSCSAKIFLLPHLIARALILGTPTCLSAMTASV